MAPRTASDQRLASETERLLGCSITRLPATSLARQGHDERIESLLEWLVGVARAATGAVLLTDEDGLLGVRAVIGIDLDAFGQIPTEADLLAFGLIVHGAEIDGDGDGEAPGAAACSHGLVDAESRMVLSLPLEIDGRRLGGVQIGYRELRSLDVAELRHLIMIADHIASAAEIARLSRQGV